MEGGAGTILVNGVAIGERAIAQEMQNHPAASPEEARRCAIEALVVRELLLQRAASLEIEVPATAERSDSGRQETPEEALIRALLEQEVETPEPDQEVCRRYYENNRQRFRTPDMYEGAHILFMADPLDEDAMSEANAKAEAALAEVLADPTGFDALAERLSDCPSGAKGGRLGWIARGQMVPEFETFLFNLEEGQICPLPVRSRFGYHIARLDRKKAGVEIPFEAASERIAVYLRESVWRRAVAQYVSLLVGRAEIYGIDMAGSSSPLVQ